MGRASIIVGLLIFAGGCNTNFGGKDFVPPLPPVVYSTTRPAQEVAAPAVAEAARPTKPLDPPVIVRPAVGLSVYQISVPIGAVSRSEVFWKRVEERAIDPGTYDILQKNGLRVGLAAMSDVEQFLKTLDRAQIQSQPAIFVASNVKKVDLPMKTGVAEQIIYDFDLKDVLTVRTYAEADDVFRMEFQPAPRKAGDVRISLTPVVHTRRAQLVAITDTQTQEFEYRNPEKFFQLNLQLDLPLDSFLVIAPSAEVQSRMSLGHTFLTEDGETRKREMVLLIVPQIMKTPVEKPAVTAAK